MSNVTVQEALNVVEQALLNAIAVMENKTELTTTQRESRKAAAIIQCKNALMELECKAALADIEKCEPVAWINDNLICPEIGYESTITTEHPIDLGWQPLYTSPQPIERCEPVAEVTAQWVIDFIGSNYNSMRTHDEQGKELPHEQITYSLTVHDLLSAFAYTSPRPREWVGLSVSDIWLEFATKRITFDDAGMEMFAKAIEAKLKQLNTKG